jgi:hypothetical protein
LFTAPRSWLRKKFVSEYLFPSKVRGISVRNHFKGRLQFQRIPRQSGGNAGTDRGT